MIGADARRKLHVGPRTRPAGSTCGERLRDSTCGERLRNSTCGERTTGSTCGQHLRTAP